MNCGDCSLGSVVAFALASRHPGPYRTSLALCHAIALLTFVASTATGDLSQVDRLWSILPALYAWMVLPVVDARTTLMACLATAWSARLTYNFHRRGGYGAWPRVWRGEEDYRWGVLRSGAVGGRWLAPLADARIMAVFNAVFISLFQNYLLLYIASPSLFVWSMATGAACCHADGGGGGGGMATHAGPGRAAVPPSMPLNVVDCIASVLFVASLVGETVADNQQRAFQNGKRAWRLANLTTTTSAGLRDGGGGGGVVSSSAPHPPSSIERQYDDGFCEFFFAHGLRRGRLSRVRRAISLT
jgi:steroid 5-alpha reductase family enzyme